MKYGLPLFEVSLTNNSTGQASSQFVGNLPTLAGNTNTNDKGWIDLSVADKLAPNTDGPFLPSVLKVLPSKIKISNSDKNSEKNDGWYALALGARAFPG